MPPARTPTTSRPSSIDVLVVSCYELGHQPVAAASAAGFLKRAGHRVQAIDLAVDDPETLQEIEGRERVALVAVATPMHTALRVACRTAPALRECFPNAHLCFFGLYALLNADHLRAEVCDSVLGGETEGPLVELAGALARGAAIPPVGGAHLERLDFAPPERGALPSLDRYARLEIDGETRIAAAVEASRGCLHLCRHCAIPSVYGGRFFVVPKGVVLDDIGRLVDAGARHLTFSDPDFFNGPGHTTAIARELHERWPALTFDVTTKVENVLRHRDRLRELSAHGCLFLVTAVESLNGAVLEALRKGHTRSDVFEAARLLREAGIAMRPTFVPFTPWETLEGYLDLLGWIESDELVGHVDPVQLSIRLLVPPGSLLLEVDSLRPHLTRQDAPGFVHEWHHSDPRMERLCDEVTAIVRSAATGDEPAPRTFERIRAAAHAAAGLDLPRDRHPPLPDKPAPRLTEPWFC